MDQTTASREVIVGLEEGLHMTPLTTLTLLAAKFSSQICIHKGDLAVDAKSMLDLLSLMAEQGTRLVVQADGSDAEEAVQAIGQLFDTNFRPV
jgi:phosphotransferase system HPr (HPr) family protein